MTGLNRRTLTLEGKEEKQFRGENCLGLDVRCRIDRFQHKTCLRLVYASAHGSLCTSSRAQELVPTNTSICININDEYV